MQLRVTAAFLAVFAALAGAVWYFGLTSPAPPTATPTTSQVLDLAAADISRVDVTDAGKTAAVERGDATSWKIVAPAADAADSARVESSVERLAKLSATRKIDDSGDLAAFGLVDPASRVELRMKDGSSHQLLVGTKTPNGSGYYVKLANAPTVYVASSLPLDDVKRWIAEPPRPRPTPTAAPSPAEAPAKPAP